MADGISTETPFNMAMLYYMELQRLMQIKHKAMLEDDLPLAYECLEEMYTMVSFKLNKKETESMDKDIKELKKIVPKVNLPDNIMASIKSKFKDKVRVIDRAMLKHMDKYKMIFPRIEMRGGLENFQKKLGLVDNG